MTRSDSSTSGSKLPSVWRKLLRLIPGYDPFRDAGECTFDVAAAQLAIDFFPGCLHHIEGDCAGQRFELEPWERSIIGNLFGWKRPDGSRRYRECLIFIPRKNGKTPVAAGLILYGLLCDNEPGAQIYGAAAEYHQASLVFRHARGMVLAKPALAKRCRVFNGQSKSITTENGLSSYRVISADAATKHGFNPHIVVVDELHTLPNSDLVDVLQTAMSSKVRRQPLLVYITTSDYERPGSVCNKMHDYAGKVRDGLINDPAFLPAIWEASIDDDWTDPKVWARANPNLDVSKSLDYMKRECMKAQESVADLNKFLRLDLNIRTEQDVRWLDLDKWDACDSKVDRTALAGRRCYGGLDLATTTDLTALVLLFPDDDGAYSVLPFFWAPVENARKRQQRDRAPYLDWATAGHLELTEGNVTDYAVIRARISELANEFGIQSIAIDRLFQGAQLATELGQDGLSVVSYGQGFLSMAAPTAEFERLVLAGKLAHGGHPILRWMASNVAVEMDAAGNMKASKKKSTERIDGIIAAIMALAMATAATDEETSVYDTDGVFVV